MRACTQTHTHTHTYTLIHTQLKHTDARAHNTLVRSDIHTCTHSSTYNTYPHSSIHTCLYTLTHTHTCLYIPSTYTYLYTLIHTCACTHSCSHMCTHIGYSHLSCFICSDSQTQQEVPWGLCSLQELIFSWVLYLLCVFVLQNFGGKYNLKESGICTSQIAS